MRFVGRSVASPADVGLLRGDARFIADLDDPVLAGAAHVVFVRSPFAHATLTSVDVSEARRAPGVVGVIAASDHQVFPRHSVFPQYFDATYAMPILAEGKVRYAGEPVAAVIAETHEQAVDAAELVEVDYDPLPAVIDPNDALADHVLLFGPGAAVRRKSPHGPDAPTSNTVMVHDTPHDASAFEHEVVVRQRFWNPRQVPTPIETHGQACAWDEVGDLHVFASTQRPHGFREQLGDLYDLDLHRIHVTAPAVGGGFGGKVSRTQEEHALPEIARQVGRPVRWIQTRSEYFQGATQGRGEQVDFVLAGSADGRIHALRGDVLKDSGAYLGVGGNLPSRFNSHGASGPYDIAHVEFGSISVVTNAPQISAFRGAGRAPYLAALERIIDMYAADIGMDPAEVRRRNLVRPEQMPFRAVTGVVYDEADYPGDLGAALALAGYDDLRREQAERRTRGDDLQLGIGVATYHLMTVGGGGENAVVRVEPDGSATVISGSTSQGHGHDATWAQIAADELGIDIERISVLEGSTHMIDDGVGAVGSRSMQTAGVAIQKASRGLIADARAVAARLLEAAVVDIEFVARGASDSGGRFHVAGVPARSVGWIEVGRAAADDGDPLMCGEFHEVGDNNSFPSGCHLAVVEVDIPTGKVALRDFVGVDDVGVRVNPRLVEGQLHGGIAAGISQALGEVMQYDADGNPLTTNLSDYGMATTDVLPSFRLEVSATPTSFNELGAKGVGESGTIGSVPAVHNAVIDALAHLGVRHLDIPCTPMRVRYAIEDAFG
ncbi:MAG: xanthine dehydrogenase family protein molybdopterin-binding subunit [Acidimicrobiales bacterium]